MKECIRSYILHGSIFCLGICMSVSKPSICFWKQVISIKWRNRLLTHTKSLTGHKKSACCLRFLVFLEISIIASFWHWRSQDFPKGCCLRDLRSVLWNWVWSFTFQYYRKYEVKKMTCILFKFIIYPSCEKVLQNRWVKSKIGNRLWTSLLVRAVALYQTLLGQTQRNPHWSKFS